MHKYLKFAFVLTCIQKLTQMLHAIFISQHMSFQDKHKCPMESKLITFERQGEDSAEDNSHFNEDGAERQNSTKHHNDRGLHEPGKDNITHITQ